MPPARPILHPGTFAIQEDNDDVREATERLRRSTSELCRQMKTIPTVIGELRRFQDSSQRSMGLLQLLRTLAEMQDVVLKRMTTTVEEERSRQELIAHYLLREKLAVRRKAELKNRLSQVRLEREKAHATRTETLTKLKADLLDVRESTQLKLKQLGGLSPDEIPLSSIGARSEIWEPNADTDRRVGGSGGRP
ncbi:hypothetical protein FOL46_008984 [Perkinsus olseni]|uniref:Dynein regulatory complex protein 10 n=1 Tax=Perkinsus olseni TaxID=32597 RepID=A0A7J6MLI9_PEROL|nr:hypothetical protein FOL46_008984 [Perkinsus olseni]